MKKLILVLIMSVPTIGFGATATKGVESRVGKFINPRTKQAIESVKKAPTLAAKTAAFKRLPTRTHLPELNPHIAQLKRAIAEMGNPKGLYLNQALQDAQNTIAALNEMRSTVTNKGDMQALNDLVTETQTLLVQLPEQQMQRAQMESVVPRIDENRSQSKQKKSALVKTKPQRHKNMK